MNSEDAKTKREAAGLINLDMSIPKMIEKVASEFCDKYCKYPDMPIPEGKDDDWLCTDEDSPCHSCPLTLYC